MRLHEALRVARERFFRSQPELAGPSFSIQPLVASDAPAVRTLVAEWRDLNTAGLVAGVVKNLDVSCGCGRRFGFAAHLRGSGELIGLVLCLDRQGAVEVAELGVGLLYRRRGIGAALLASVLAASGFAQRIVVGLVRETDVGGLSWLSRRGFAPVANFEDGRFVLQDAFGEGVDGIVVANRNGVELGVRVAR